MKPSLALVLALATPLAVSAAACGKRAEPTPAPATTPGGSGAPSAVLAGGDSAPLDALALDASAPAAALPPAGPPLDRAGMQTSVLPGDDFFAYANGAWFAATEIPADRSTYGAGAVTDERTDERVATLIKDAAAQAAPGTEARKVGDYYATFMDEAAIEAKGIAPLQPTLDRYAALADSSAVARAIGETLRTDVDAFNNTNFETPNLFGVWIAQDVVDPTKYVTFLLQGGLGMPSREYYLDSDPKMIALRTAYEAHVVRNLKLAGIADPEAKAKAVVALETALAHAHATRLESEPATNALHHWARADFDKRAPGLDWAALLDGAGLAAQTDFVVWQPKAFTAIAKVAKATPLATWQAFLIAHAIDNAAVFLPKAFADEHFAFYGSALSGTPAQRDRWKRGVAATSDALGEAVGKLYVAKYFPDAAKQKITALVKTVLAAFGRRIDGLAWMTPATKAKAQAKLAALTVGVGFPDHWRDFGGLEVVAGDAVGNAERGSKFEYQRNLAKLGQPVDRSEWVMNPQLVNAVNLPVMNAMNFPAAILQEPYFDASRPDVMNYGAIGAIIGHEISHSFDDQGAMFDATGKLQNWWTPADLAHFKQQSAALAAQYSAYKPFPDLAVKGEQTLSENIADVAGLAAAFDAYRMAYAGQEAPTWEGLTGDQQFFVSFAQSWRTKMREPELRRRIVTDGHAPGEYRADTVRNLDAWYAAFDVKPPAKLYLAPAARVKIW